MQVPSHPDLLLAPQIEERECLGFDKPVGCAILLDEIAFTVLKLVYIISVGSPDTRLNIFETELLDYSAQRFCF